ncbi:MAG: hypothetical protein V4457_06100 [Pseudomonadota bacterium]
MAKLERAVVARMDKSQGGALVDLVQLADIRAARSDVAPLADQLFPAPSQEGEGSAGGAAPVAGGLKDSFGNEYQPVMKSTLDRLRADSRWAREVAVPALEYYERMAAYPIDGNRATEALAAMPPEGGRFTDGHGNDITHLVDKKP